MAYLFSDIVTAVKQEGRVLRSNDLDSMIKSIINEVMVKHTRNKQYPQLYTPNQALAITSNGQNSFALPTGFTHISQVLFSVDGTAGSFKFLQKQNQFQLPFQVGLPSWWYYAGNQLYIYPYTQIITTNVLQIGLFKAPALLAADTDPLLIDDLYPVILLETLSRLRRYHADQAGDVAYKQDAEEAQTTQQDDPQQM